MEYRLGDWIMAGRRERREAGSYERCWVVEHPIIEFRDWDEWLWRYPNNGCHRSSR